MSNRRTAITVGILFIVQMILSAVGTSLIKAFTQGNPDKTPLTIGALLMVLSGVTVVGIGVLMYRVLKEVNQKLAFWYSVFRVMELAASAICGVYLLTHLKVVPNYMLWLYIPTGIGGLILTYLLFVSKLVPRAIAALGFIGYASLLLGVVVSFLGLFNMNKGSGQILLAPGGLFEVVFLPLWLITKGFTKDENDTGTTVNRMILKTGLVR